MTAAAAPAFRVQGVHHFAYKCKDPVLTRHFYEQVLGMPLAHTVRATHIPSTGGEPVHYFHMFFCMHDGSYMAFFDLGDDEAAAPSPNTAPWVNHLALEVADEAALLRGKALLEQHGIAVVGPLDHDFIKSIYFFDPNGIRLEFTTRVVAAAQRVYGPQASPDDEFERWLAERARAREFAASWAVAQRE